MNKLYIIISLLSYNVIWRPVPFVTIPQTKGPMDHNSNLRKNDHPPMNLSYIKKNLCKSANYFIIYQSNKKNNIITAYLNYLAHICYLKGLFLFIWTYLSPFTQQIVLIKFAQSYMIKGLKMPGLIRQKNPLMAVNVNITPVKNDDFVFTVSCRYFKERFLIVIHQ